MNISIVQSNLVLLGFGSTLRPSGVDGRNGRLTRKAVRDFQRMYNQKFKKNIGVDGIAGKQSEKAFNHWIRQAGNVGTKNFRISEFNNKGVGRKMHPNKMDRKLITGLEKLRYLCGDRGIIINSGYRNPTHNRAVGGATNSQHLYGKAADIRVIGVKPSTVYNRSLAIFDGVGKYNTFTHVDTRGYKARF